MTFNRRKFLAAATTFASGCLWMSAHAERKTMVNILPDFQAPKDLSLQILATNWGFDGNFEAFCAKAKESGYDGVEVWFPQEKAEQDDFFNAVEKHSLSYGFLTGGWDSNFETHFDQFKSYIGEAITHNPLFINCHAGRDYFTFEESRRIIDFTIRLSRDTGVPIYHETHRSRMLFAAHITRDFIEQIPDLRLTLDISHWCNVHESLLQDQPESVARALGRTDHIHSRVGHAESPQVTDPRAPEWAEAVKAHFEWWDKVVEMKAKAGKPLTMTTEFGPPAYMPAIPYTRQPLANLWEVNAFMLQMWRERYG